MNCHYYITVPVGRRIQITFPVFDTESCCDHVTIYNVVGRSQVYKSRFSGSGNRTFESKTNKVYVWFLSDSKSSRQGFAAYYTSFKGMKASFIE